MAEDQDDLLNPDEIEALLNSQLSSPPSDAGTEGNAPPPAPSDEGTLSQNDLDDLFKSAPKKGSPAPTPPKASAPVEDTGVLDASEIEALLKQREAAKPRRSSPDALLDQAEADLAAAIAPELDASRRHPSELRGTKSYEFEDFGGGQIFQEPAALEALQEVELDLRIELGRTELLIEEVLKLREGSVVPLDKLAGDPVDILVNGRLVARGEVLVLNDNFCVRIAEILSPNF